MPLRPPSAPRLVAMVAYPGVHALDVIGALEVFSAASVLAPRAAGDTPPYATAVVATAAGPLETQSGIGLVASRTLGSLRGGVDTLLVAGGLGATTALGDRALLSPLRPLPPGGRRPRSGCPRRLPPRPAGPPPTPPPPTPP